MKLPTITSITLFSLSLRKKVSLPPFVIFKTFTTIFCDPVIEKERIRTTVPIHEVIHEAPIIHQPRSHTPITLQVFANKFGPLEGLSQDDIVKKVLGDGKCVREEGAADSSGDMMNLGNKVSLSSPFVSCFFLKEM